jgi:hypothetical protein
MSLHPFMTWEQKVQVLARYNGEVARGIEHRANWKESMAELQREFNAAQMRDLVEQNTIVEDKMANGPGADVPRRRRWWQR